MYLLLSPGGTVKVTHSDQDMVDHLKANPLNEAHGFAGWTVQLENGEPCSKEIDVHAMKLPIPESKLPDLPTKGDGR
jgi:hypothetical protein